MGVKVEDEWRFKRIKSEIASKSAFAFKINRKLKQHGQPKTLYGYGNVVPYSREVIVKITGGARSKKGIRNIVEYISKGWQEEIVDSNGVKYKTKEEMRIAVSLLQENVVTDVEVAPRKKLKLTQNMMFSAPKIAHVKKEDSLKATVRALTEKYPDNYFVAVYHDETDNPHVHIVVNINKDNGDRIDIRKKDLRDVRESYCKNLIGYGYDVRASRKYENEKYSINAKRLKELGNPP